jgi:AraC family transcriptional regulator of adaptative response/methylated-DNA-[protein]-cysteine methyltransferase
MASADRKQTKQVELSEVARYLEEHAELPLSLSTLAKRFGVAAQQLHRQFFAQFGVTPKAFQDAARARAFKRGLKSGERVTDAIIDAGYGSTSRSHMAAARHLGMTPKRYRAGGAGEQLHYLAKPSALGWMLMAASRRGICFVQFGASEAELMTRLQEEFPNASLTLSEAGDGEPISDWMRALDAHLEARAPRPELPLDLRGTAFQIRVWRFLLGLDRGEVISYSELAKGIEAPRAVRAAASACAANRIAVLVPCHRVLRGDGGMGGYRWGLERKRSLLAMERATGAASGHPGTG